MPEGNTVNVRDEFDDWKTMQDTELHNLTIAEIWMAGFDAGRDAEAQRHEIREGL